MAFMNAVLAIADPGDEIDPAGAVLLQPRDGDRDGGRRPVRRADRRELSARPGRDRARDHAANARRRHGLAEQPDRRRLSRSRAARGQRAVPRRAASSTSTTRPTSTSPTAARALFAGDRSRRPPAHTISLFSLSKAYGMASWRIGYMVIPDAPVRRGQQDPGHDPDLPARRVAACGACARSTSGAAYCDAASSSELDARGALVAPRSRRRRVPCDVPPAEGAFYYFLRVHAALDPFTLVERLIREHRVGGDPGNGVRRVGRLLAADLVRRARRGDGDRGTWRADSRVKALGRQ